MVRIIASIALVVFLGFFSWGVYDHQHDTGNGISDVTIH